MFNCKFCDKKSVNPVENQFAYKCDCCGKEVICLEDIMEEMI